MSFTDSIKKCPLFCDLYEDEFEDFVNTCAIASYEPGTNIINHGEQGDDFFVILEGNVDITVPQNGEQIKLATLQSGEFFGELVLIDDPNRNATVRANDKTTCLVIKAEIFYDFYNKKTKLFALMLLNITKILIKRLKESNEKVAILQN